MNTRVFLATTAAAALIFGAAATAQAQVTISGSYSATVTADVGNAPTLSSAGSSPLDTTSSSSSPYSFSSGSLKNGISLTANGASVTDNLLTINPSTSCGYGCGSNDTASATIGLTFGTIDFNGTAMTPVTSDADSGTFYADYNSNSHPLSGIETACTTTSGGSDTDCVGWSSSNDPIDFTLTTGGYVYTLAITLDDAQDWSITPQVTLTLTSTPSSPPIGTPEPASMALFATGLVGLGAIRRRMTRKSRKAAA